MMGNRLKGRKGRTSCVYDVCKGRDSNLILSSILSDSQATSEYKHKELSQDERSIEDYTTMLEQALHVAFQQYSLQLQQHPLGRGGEEHLVRMVEILLRHGASVNSRGAGGRTPLAWCVELGLVEVLRILVKYPELDTDVRWLYKGAWSADNHGVALHKGAWLNHNHGVELHLYHRPTLYMCLEQSTVALFHLICAPVSLIKMYNALVGYPPIPALFMLLWAGLGEETFTVTDTDPASFRSHQLMAFKTLLKQECCPLEEGTEIIFSSNPQYPLNRCLVWDRRSTFHQTRGALVYCTSHFLSLHFLARAAVRRALVAGAGYRSILPSVRKLGELTNTVPRSVLREVYMFSQAMGAFPRNSNHLLELFQEELEVRFSFLPKV